MITINNKIQIPIQEIGSTQEDIKKMLTLKNPAYGEALGRLKAMGRPNAKPYNIQEIIKGYYYQGNELIVPRGIAGQIIEMLGLEVNDQTRKLPKVEFNFKGDLKPSQVPVVEAILGRRFSTIESPTGSGKTIMGLYVIAQRKQPTIVVVHTTALLKQWIERAEAFLGIPSQEIGIIGQGERRVAPKLTIALTQTLSKFPEKFSNKISHLVIDECHHTPATTFTKIVTGFDAAFMLGLSATHKRRDGLTPLIYWYIGPLVYQVSRSSLTKGGEIIDVQPIIRQTNFHPSPNIDQIWERNKLIEELCEDYSRNLLIAQDVRGEILLSSGPCIVLSDRTLHCEVLADILIGLGINAKACHGGIPKKQQEFLIQSINDNKLQVLVATGQLLGEGFDCKQLKALFLATPIKFSGRLIQYLGRVARSAEGKKLAKVYDYADINVPVLMKAYRERIRTYNKLRSE